MLEINGLSKTFGAGTPAETRALQGIDLEVEEGSFVVIIGTNGSGKSTLLSAVAGTFLPDAGKVYIAGQDVTTWQEHQRASLIGRVFQNPFSGTAPDLSVEENLALAARRGRARGLGWALSKPVRAEIRKRVNSLGLALEDRITTPIGSLSGGQRQALTLLMATWQRPSLLLLDEHTAALDPRSADKVIRLSQEAIARDKLTALMVTHSMHQAASLGDRLVMMNRGRILHDFRGSDKRRLHPEDLLAYFEEVRRSDQLDESAAEILRQAYV